MLVASLALALVPTRHVVVPCDKVSRSQHCCGDGQCNGGEDEITCLADCPGVTTDAMCGEEPHSDRGGRTMALTSCARTEEMPAAQLAAKSGAQALCASLPW